MSDTTEKYGRELKGARAMSIQDHLPPTEIATQDYLPSVEVAPTVPAPPGINPDLIRQYAAGASDFGLEQLVTLFNFQRRRLLQSEMLKDAYLRQICTLQQELSRLRTGAPTTDHRPGPSATGVPIAKKKPLTPSAEVVIDADSIDF